MSSEEEFAGRARIDITRLQVWLDEGWIVPSRIGGDAVFSEVDLARAALIRDLDVLMGVNDEGIGVILGLVDQLHMLRRDFDTMVEALKAARAEDENARTGNVRHQPENTDGGLPHR
ncbi:MerR family transcriptional regulator [Mesorhizobium sp. ANAO-SY3R2]|uniref:MerR family transcriptional regulator n=1 Tax=Mesorhizobium sp. ANAO-SY3R2 TaxID=3166644 RepID=UPI003672C6C4